MRPGSSFVHAPVLELPSSGNSTTMRRSQQIAGRNSRAVKKIQQPLSMCREATIQIRRPVGKTRSQHVYRVYGGASLQGSAERIARRMSTRAVREPVPALDPFRCVNNACGAPQPWPSILRPPEKRAARFPSPICFSLWVVVRPDATMTVSRLSIRAWGSIETIRPHRVTSVFSRATS